MILCCCEYGIWYNVEYSHTDYNISWESSSYSLTEDSGGAMICANGSGTLQGNLRINLSTVTQDDTATGTQAFISV